MATATVSGGTQNAGQAVSSSNVTDTTKALLNNVNGTGGVFTTGVVGTASSPALVQGGTNSVFVVDGKNSVVQVGTQQSTFVIVDTTATVAGGTGSGTIVGGTGNTLLGTSTAPGGKYQLLGSLGNDTVIAVAGTNTIQGGAGNNIHGVFGGTNTVGVGQVTGANDTVIASGGSNTVFGGSQSALIGMTGGTNVVVGGAAAETIIAAGGSSTIFGGGGKDTFLFTKLDSAGAKHVVADFGAGGVADTVAIVGTGLAVSQASIDTMLSTATVSGSNVTLNVGSNVTVTFNNTTVAALRGNIVLG